MTIRLPSCDLSAAERPKQAQELYQLFQQLSADDTQDYHPAHWTTAPTARKRRSKAPVLDGESSKKSAIKGGELCMYH
jgi:hypothetical protein